MTYLHDPDTARLARRLREINQDVERLLWDLRDVGIGDDESRPVIEALQGLLDERWKEQ